MTDLCKQINKFGKGIGHATRYRILEALMKGQKTVGDIAKMVDVSQPVASQHLKVLKESDLVLDTKVGKEVYYGINTEQTLTLLTALVKDLEKKKVK